MGRCLVVVAAFVCCCISSTSRVAARENLDQGYIPASQIPESDGPDLNEPSPTKDDGKAIWRETDSDFDQGERSESWVAQHEQSIQSSSGCCFEIGFGTRMKPCCLKKLDKGKDECESAGKGRVGGAVGYTEGECPTTSAQAKSLLDAAR